MQKRHLIPLLIVILLHTQTAWAGIVNLKSSGPLLTRTQHPLYLQFLAMPMESPKTLHRQQFETILTTTFSNLFEYDLDGQTQYNLDMEVWRTSLIFGYGLTDTLDVRIEVPMITNSGGFMDGTIQWYHNLFGFPNGGRDLVSNNQFSYSFTQNGNTLLNHSSTPLGLSDMSLRLKFLLSDYTQMPFQLSLVPYLKIPTGQSSKGLGSGHFDVGFSLFAKKDILKRFYWFSQLGVIALGGQNHLDPILKNLSLAFGQSFEFQILDGLSVITQLTGNTSFFRDIDSSDLKKIVLDLNVGFAGSFPLNHSLFHEFYYQWSFSEDVLSQGPSVDFSVLFLAGVKY